MLKGALIGCGYFANNHLNAWRDVIGAELIAVCDQDGDRAQKAAELFDIPNVYTDAGKMLNYEDLDFVDVVTQAPSHRPLVELIASLGVNVICQKPFAPTIDDARAMVIACKRANVQLMVHENFRWQRPIRALKAASEKIGDLFFGRIAFRHAHDIFTNQPYLATDVRFIIYDLGIHLLDVARFCMGDVSRLFCHAQSINPKVNGEDTATIMLVMESGATCVVEACHFSHLENDTFPQTLIHLEGTRGSATLDVNYTLTTVVDDHTTQTDVPPQPPSWASGPGVAVQESVVAISQHWTDCLKNGSTTETSGLDNLKTLELVFGAYESADTKMAYTMEASLGI
ncbi:MAG: Gfo/Idh/MocA family oxidoreductase [Candidatus Latescibacteria bacterium]|nr:Gfo/Idh/MocA family oxidoreductase [Candidatus Latescibacterota bacterium]MBT5829394.1 Gfo/Idh/MocA family oxidoreductase [Candidatus Latescibacterota bacterium]